MNAPRWQSRLAIGVLAVAALSESALADDSARVQELYVRAYSLSQQGKMKEAIAAYEQALVAASAVLGERHRDTTGIMGNLANLYRAVGQFAKAEPLYLRALAIKEEKLGKDHPDTAATLNNLGVLYKDVGQFAKAEPLYQRALAIKEEKLGKNHPATATTVNNLANIYYDVGQSAKAEPLYLRALSIREEKLGKDHLDTAATVNNLANLYGAMGQSAKAESLHLRALAIKEEKLGKDHPDTATTINNLAILYDDMGQSAKAEPLYHQALAIREEKLGKDHPHTAATLNNLGVLYKDMGQSAKAEPLYQQALAIREEKLGKDHPHTAATVHNLASLYQAMGQSAKAEPLYMRALAVYEAKLCKDHPNTATTVNSLALCYEDAGEWDRATGLRDRARRQARGFLAAILPMLSQREQDQFLRTQDYSRFHAALSHGLVRRDAPADRVRSADWVLNGKAVAGQARAEAVLLARETRDPRAGPLARQLAETRQALAALTLHPPEKLDPATRSRQAAELAAREQDLARQLAQATGREATAAWIELADVRKAVPRDGVLIEVARFDRKNVGRKPGEKWSLGDRYAAWVILPAGDVTVVDLGDAGPIDAAVTAVRKELEQADKTIQAKGEPAAEKQLRQPLDALAALVLKPLLPHVGAAKTWVVSPDSNLWLVPWAALPLPDGKYVAEAHDVRYVVSGRDLLARKNTKVTPTAPLVLADPDFDLGLDAAAAATRRLLQGGPDEHRGLSKDFVLGNVRRLPGTGAEAEAIAPKLKAYAGADPVLRTDAAALTGVFKAVKNPRVVVLSTHGFFLEEEKIERKDDRGAFADDRRPAGPVGENPFLRCGLLLAGCNHAVEAKPGSDSGVLTGLEIVGTDLRGTELVVLSACETGLGDVKTGEGVAGLRQAFQLAGAESVVATLWQVPDRESALLMTTFFDQLSAKAPRDAALATAQRDMVKQRRDRFGAAHPYFWAAYTLTGQAN